MNKKTISRCLLWAIWIICMDWTANSHAETQTAAVGQQQPVLLFVHGLFGNGLKSWKSVILRLPLRREKFRYGGNLKANSRSRYIDKRADFFTLSFSDPDSLTFEQQGKELGEIVNNIKEHIDRPIILIGSSMGGLAIRAFLADRGSAGIAGVITINSPHVGSILGLLKNYTDQLQAVSRAKNKQHIDPRVHDAIWAYVKRLEWMILGLDLQAPAVQYLNPGSPELLALAQKGLPKDIPYACLLSNWYDNTGDFELALKDLRNYLYSISSQEETPYGAASQLIHENWGDGIVSLWSQDIKSIGAGAHGIRLFRKIVDQPKFTFHTNANENIADIMKAVEWIISAYKAGNTGTSVPDREDAAIIGHSGELKVTLQWRGNADLDLHVEDPCGQEISYQNQKSTCAGKEGNLDVDANANCTKHTSMEPAENIYWTRVSPGSYKILVHCYSMCGSQAPIPFTLTVFNDNKRTSHQGQVNHSSQMVEVTSIHAD